jgi:putative transposase
MPRPARIVVPDIPHHVTHRGSHRRDIFFTDQDRLRYLAILKKQCERTGLIVHGYCLMGNHVHLIVTPPNEHALGDTIGQAHRQWALYLNYKKRSSGHIWHNRYYSCPMDEGHFLQCLLYVDRNPIRAGLVSRPEEWLWSSARMHMGKIDQSSLVDIEQWKKLDAKINWLELVRNTEDQVSIEAIRRNTQTGTPLGSEMFLEKIEASLGYSVRRKKPGRPSAR